MKNMKMKFQKRALQLFLVNILFMMYNMTFGGGYSIDSYAIVRSNYQGHVEAFLGAYRFFGAGLFKFFRLFGYDPISNAMPSVVAYIFIVAASITWLVLRFQKAFPGKSILSIELAVLVASTNCWYCDILSFPECILITAIGSALTFFAVGLIADDEKQGILNYIFSAIFLILATGIYQQFLSLFAVYAIAICCARVWRSEKHSIKDFLLIFFRPALLWTLSAVSYFATAKVICNISGIQPNPRIAHGLPDIFQNALHILRNVHSYVKGRGFFTSEVLTVCFLIAIALFAAALIHEVIKNRNYACAGVVAVSAVVATLLSLLPAFLSCTSGTRAMFAVFAMYGFIALVIPQKVKVYSSMMTAVLVFVILLNIGKTIECEMNLKKINTADELWAKQVVAEIAAYETRSNTEIKVVFVADDGEWDSIAASCAYTQSARYVDYARTPLILLWSGDHDYAVENMPKNEYDKFFAGKNWDVYLPAEQIVFQGDTAYICCY